MMLNAVLLMFGTGYIGYPLLIMNAGSMSTLQRLAWALLAVMFFTVYTFLTIHTTQIYDIRR